MNNSGKSFNSFLLGALIGAGLVFLLGTPKGKKVLKAITDGGLNLAEILDEGVFEEEEIVSSPKQSKSSHVQTVQTEDVHIDEKTEPVSNGNGVVKVTTSPRRFFRGIPRR